MHARLFQAYRSLPGTPGTDTMSPPITPPGNVASGCTWHTIPEPAQEFWPSFRPLSIAQHLPPSPLQQQVHELMSSTIGHVDAGASAHITDVLVNTANGISILKRALGDHVVGSLVALLLKDQQPLWEEPQHHLPPPSPHAPPQAWYFPQGSPVISSAQASGFLPEGLLE